MIRHRIAAIVLMALVGGTMTGGCHELLGVDDFGPAPPASISDSLCDAGQLGTTIEKIDLLFVIDNSINMLDKSTVLAESLEALLQPLVNPACLSPDGSFVSQPESSLEPCPVGAARDYPPVNDLRIGVISSSLGDYGGNGCPTEPGGVTGYHPEKDDRGHLLTRGPDGATVPTYNDLGFLWFDPASSEDGERIRDFDQLNARLSDLVLGVGENGCGYEAILEAWYRFLVDPKPYEAVQIVDGKTKQIGVDETILAQRGAFIRDDSLLVVVMLSDEDDCSVAHEDDQQGFIALDLTLDMPRASAACASNPDDACCYSCLLSAPDGCPNPDPACEMGTYLPAAEDTAGLRCFDQKRRFGFDFLYPTERYVNALTQAFIDPDAPNLVPIPTGASVPNPLFEGSRRTDSIVLAGIVGVPWQTIARRNADGAPDLENGLNQAGLPAGGFRTSTELENEGIWNLLLAETASDEPDDPFMIGSPDPRQGGHPFTGDQLAECTVGNTSLNAINGCEYDQLSKQGLQYACVHLTDEETDCTAPGADCKCDPPSPICSNPSMPGTKTHSGAAPSPRQLEVLRGLGNRAVVASACRAEATPGEASFGYVPMLQAITDYVRQPLSARCPPFPISISTSDTPPSCRMIEAREIAEGASCDCPGPGKGPMSAEARAVRNVAVASGSLPDTNCYCELTRLEGFELAGCQNDLAFQPTNSGEPISGWCLVDPAGGVGNPDLSTNCPNGVQFRILGNARPDSGGQVYLGCFDDSGTCGG